jgi:hypothetical protein
VPAGPLIEREEVVTLLFVLLDIRQELNLIRLLLEDEEDE